jgi:hypothetical protein
MEAITKQEMEVFRELEILREFYNSGQITVDEFLTFAPLTFAPKLLEMIKKRRDNLCCPPAESSLRSTGTKTKQ